MGKGVIGNLVVAHEKVTGDAAASWAEAFYRRDVPALWCFDLQGGMMPPFPLKSERGLHENRIQYDFC